MPAEIVLKPKPRSVDTDREDPDFRDLTRVPLKSETYRREVYFREGLDLFHSIFGQNALQTASHTALLVIKPDGICGNKTPMVLDFLDAHGFECIASCEIDMSEKVWRELWRYQLTSATFDRLAINDHLFKEPSLFLLLKDKVPTSNIPTSVRLSRLKGASNMLDQSPDCLRRIVGQANRILSCIHVADEPADIIRECALLLPRHQQTTVLSALKTEALTQPSQASINAALKLGKDQKRTFELSLACERLARTLVGIDTPGAFKAQQMITQATENQKISFRELRDCLAESGAQFDEWDLIIVGSYSMVYDEPGHPKLIGNPPADAWDTPV
ncbi:MAG: nucleoside-diphosphate kinase [Sulfitobacter sp.]